MLENVSLTKNDKKNFDFNLPGYVVIFFVYLLPFKPS